MVVLVRIDKTIIFHFMDENEFLRWGADLRLLEATEIHFVSVLNLQAGNVHNLGIEQVINTAERIHGEVAGDPCPVFIRGSNGLKIVRPC